MCHKDFEFFIICYKVIDVYLSNIHFHNTDTLIACNIDTYLFIMCVRYDTTNFRKKTYELRVTLSKRTRFQL